MSEESMKDLPDNLNERVAAFAEDRGITFYDALFYLVRRGLNDSAHRVVEIDATEYGSGIRVPFKKGGYDA